MDVFPWLQRALSSLVSLPPASPNVVPGKEIIFTLDANLWNQTLDISFTIVHIGWYDIYEDKNIEILYREFIARIGPELTHNSDSWDCFECGRPATDSAWLSIYSETEEIYNRCALNIGRGCDKCAPKMQEATRKIVEARQNNGDSPSTMVVGTIPKPDGMGRALFSACLACRKPETAAPEFAMSRCSKCHLVRYDPRTQEIYLPIA
ncbi:hypothetical protein B0H17DRAFT_1136781 [Mycena rosella]|uniref:Uncharacterized protein n=1 Tax=Mycena rosella TaxID=1033263 RepID=A0AAD7DAH0_MYCRO|nr:hypothetical protein B0H17DRAFT_1136781 [Mycena rosella]